MYEDNVITKMDTGNELIQKVIEYIIENYHNDITMAATAELLNRAFPRNLRLLQASDSESILLM